MVSASSRGVMLEKALNRRLREIKLVPDLGNNPCDQFSGFKGKILLYYFTVKSNPNKLQ